MRITVEKCFFVKKALVFMHFVRKSGQHGSKLASKNDQKSIKNRCQNRSKIWCILGSIFGRILMNFRKKNRGMLALKSNKNRCQLRKAIFWKNPFIIVEAGLEPISLGSKRYCDYMTHAGVTMVLRTPDAVHVCMYVWSRWCRPSNWSRWPRVA